jgi:hypothetical protein
MGTDEAKLIYRLRAQTAEWVNAQCRNRGLYRMPVRGQPRCCVISLLFAITFALDVSFVPESGREGLVAAVWRGAFAVCLTILTLCGFILFTAWLRRRGR